MTSSSLLHAQGFTASKSCGRSKLPDTVPFFDGAAVNGFTDVMAPIHRVIESGCYVLGAEVEAFEASFAAFLGVQGCVGVNSGTDALELALRALEVGPHSRVLMVANAAFYGSAAAYAVGAQPVYVDVEPTTACMDPQRLEDCLKTSGPYDAIIVTHLYGQMAAITEIVGLAKRYGMAVIEDCAQAHGATLRGQKAGTLGDLGTFSFYPTKNLGALGDGGAIVSGHPHLVERARALRQYGWHDKYTVNTAGGRNSRLDALQAAILSAKLPGLREANAYRRRVAQRYQAALNPCDLPSFAVAAEGSVAHLFVVRHNHRDALARHLSAHNVATLVHFPVPDHRQKAYQPPAGSGPLPVTERLADTVLSLPCYPGMPMAHVDRVIACVKQFVEKNGRGV